MGESKGIGTKFEKEIVTLLKELEFSDVDGARNDFRLGGVQIDAIAGWQKSLLIFECITQKNLGKKDLSEKISSFRGKMDLIREGIASSPIYGYYRDIRFVLATKNIEIREVDKELARKDHDRRIYIWFGDFLEYYANQYRFIKPYAKYDLLGELGVKPITTGPITVPAFRTTVHGTAVYTFLMNPKDLLEVAFVARREKGGEQYYQRIINEERLSKIATYVKKGGLFPNNIILAFREDLPATVIQATSAKEPIEEKNLMNGVIFREKFVDKRNLTGGIQFGLLSFPRDFRSCWIIDGQHRLYAFAGIPADLDFKMPITAFEKLPIQLQRKYFLDINRFQKPVDSDLLWDLSGDFPENLEGIISNSIKFLNTHKDSPLRELIYYPSAKKLSKKGKLKISALCIALKKNRIADLYTFQKISNPLHRSQPEKHYTRIAWSLIEYFLVVQEIFPNNWSLGSKKGFLLSNGGMAVALALFERILSRVAEGGRIATPFDYKRYLTPLVDIIEDSDQKIQKQFRLRATSEGGKTGLVTELVLHIRKIIGDNRFGGAIEIKTYDREFLDLENLLKELIRKYYFDEQKPNWLASLVDDYTLKKSLKINEKNSGKVDPTRAYWGLTLGECFTLLNNNFEKVANVFLNDEEYSFSNQEEFKFAGTTIGRMRAKTIAHATGSKTKKGEIETFRTLMSRMQSCLQAELSVEEVEEVADQPTEED